MKNIFLFCLIAITPCFIGCGPSAEELAAYEKVKQDSIAAYEAAAISNQSGQKAQEVQESQEPQKPKIQKTWISREVGLPKGTVMGGEFYNNDLTNNYIEVLKTDGTSTVVKNLDPAVWTVIQKGDIIK